MGIYIIETFVGIDVFTANSSKFIWIVGGLVSNSINYIWYWLFKNRQKRDSFAMIIGVEVFFIGASLLGFGTAYIFIDEKYAYSNINLWPIKASINIILGHFGQFLDSVGLDLIPVTVMLSIPVVGVLLILISYPLCFVIESSYWPRIAVACSVYFLVNVFDYIMTINGILSQKSEEGNPIIQKYIDYYGLLKGVLFHKFIMCGMVILGVIIFSLRIKYDEKNNLISENILYWGSVLTLIAVAMWVKLYS